MADDLTKIGVGLRSVVLAASPVAALVAARMYPVELPQNSAMPAILYTIVSEVGEHSSQHAQNLSMARVQIDSWGVDFDSANDLAGKVRQAIDGYKGALGASSGLTAQAIFFSSRQDIYEPIPKLFRVLHDYFVWYQATAS